MEVYHDMRGCGLAPSNPLFQSLMDLYVEQGLERPIEPADTLPFDWMAALHARSTLSALAEAAGKDSLSNPAAPLPNIIDNSYIDLHGLSTVEARAAVLAALRSLDLAMLEQVKPIPLQDLVIVTGRGQNSTDGLPVVRHAVLKLLEELKISVVASPPQNQLEDGTQPPDETLPCIDGEGASTSRPTSAAAQQKAQNEHQDGMQAGGQSAARGDQHKLWNVGRVIVSKELLISADRRCILPSPVAAIVSEEESDQERAQVLSWVKLRPPEGLDIERPPAGLDIERPPEGLDIERPPEGLDIERPPEGLDIERPPEGLDIERPPAGLDIERPPEGLDVERPPEGLDIERPPE
eukprot:gene23905-29006_t